MDNSNTLSPTTEYSFLCCKPRCLQFFNTVRWHVFWQCMYIVTQGFLINGLINIVLVSLETRFGLSSSRSAVIVSSHDFGAVIFIVLAGYFGERCHKPRVMASGIFLMSVGSFLFALPHFISGRYQYTVSGVSNSTANVCRLSPTNTTEALCEGGDNSNDLYYGVMILGSVLLGIGHVPTFVLGLGYIDENSDPRDSAFHMAFTFCAGALGSAIGYVAGGQTLKLFVDFEVVGSDFKALLPSDPQWVGAWWLGVLAACLMFLLVAFPIWGYPKHLPGYETLQKQRGSEVYKGKEHKATDPTEKPGCGGVQRHIKNLIANPTFWLVVVSATIEVFIITGLSTFAAKICQQYFGISMTEAGYLMGFITVPGSGGGVLLGGYLVKRFNLKVRGIIRMSATCLFVCVLLGPTFLAVCPRHDIAGVTTPYANDSSLELISRCNSDCRCSTAGYEPVCGKDNVQYFSPCHAGCTVFQEKNATDQKIYQDCRCSSTDGPLRSGTCSSEKCTWYYVFCVLLFVMMILTFATMSPLIQAMIRCIPQEERSFALGMQLLLGRLLGTTPGPLFVGAIIDGECLVWKQGCDGPESCWIYTTKGLSVKIMVWWIGSKLLGTVLLFIADRTYRPPSEESTDTVYSVEVKHCETTVHQNGTLSTRL